MEWFKDPVYLWREALREPMPLFKSAPEDLLIAIFDAKGFFLSPEAKKIYNRVVYVDGRSFKLKDLPHIYAARAASGDNFYFGISTQKGGRFKRSHAYHLRTLAYQIIHGSLRRDLGDQDHSRWIDAWFEAGSLYQTGAGDGIRMREMVLVSFFVPDVRAMRDQLLEAEHVLIGIARQKGLRVLNNT